jgi:recombination protein RecA
VAKGSARTSSGSGSSANSAKDASRKDQALSYTLGQVEKQFGKGTIMKLGESPIQEISGISTGSLGLDLAVGGKGLPQGRIVEIFGPESSGKTTLALHVVANAQKHGGRCLFIDAEHAMDPLYARKLGVDINELYLSQPDTGEQALEIAEMMVRTNAVSVIVVDSVAALVPKAELEGDMGDVHVGLQARLMSQALRKLTAAVSKSSCCFIFINQIREKIGVMFGSPETTAGGRALKFYASVRLDVRRIARIKDGDQAIGNRTKVTVVKNKIAPPFRVTEFDIMFNEGISWAGELLDLGVQHEVVDKSGTWFSYGDERLGQGRERVRIFLKENPDVADRIRNQVLAKVAPPPEEPQAPTREEAGAGAPPSPVPSKEPGKASGPVSPTRTPPTGQRNRASAS